MAPRSKIPVFLFVLFIQPIFACTIFVLTDENNVLFFNNEDYTNSNTKIWFIPEGKGHYGCAFVGYDDGSAQGGVNTQGLAFDWYAGKPEDYTPSEELLPIADNSSERMLEQCATVKEAITFYKTYREAGFSKASILIADKSGASVIIGARNGKLYFDSFKQSSVLGGRGKTIFRSLYSSDAPVTLSYGSELLNACVATGQGGTLYSNAYDLKTGTIYFFNFREQESAYEVLDLKEELAKGAHYYNIPAIKNEIVEAVKPLELNMERLILFDYEDQIIDSPELTSFTKEVFTGIAKGTPDSSDFSETFWRELKPYRNEVEEELMALGSLQSVDLIRVSEENTSFIYSFVMVFKKARLLEQIRINENGKIEGIETLSSFVESSTQTTATANKGTPGKIMLYGVLFLGLLCLGYMFFKKKTNLLSF